MGRQVRLFLGASGAHIKELDVSETIETAELSPGAQRRLLVRLLLLHLHPALAQGH